MGILFKKFFELDFCKNILGWDFVFLSFYRGIFWAIKKLALLA